MQPFGRLFVDGCLDKGLEQGAIQTEVDLRYPLRGSEAAFVFETGWTMARRSSRVRGSKRTIQSPVTRSGWTASAVLGVIAARTDPAAARGCGSMLEANSWCSFLAIPPPTKMPRWPTLSWMTQTMVWPQARMSSSLP